MSRRLQPNGIALTAFALITFSACSTGEGTVGGSLPGSASATSTAPPEKSCSSDPRAHVYNPDRLQLLAACVTVTGAIDSIDPQADGDFHVWLHLDAGQACGGHTCLDADNVSGLAGDLLLEPVCEHVVTQADAMAACKGYRNPLIVPPVGDHVSATGPFVLDAIHGWNEIHPLESITASPASTPTATANELTPTTATSLTVTITTSTYGSLEAMTLPLASCRAQAQLPSGRISTAAGLQVTVTAGPDGNAAWSYRTSVNAEHGTGTHTVTCNLNGTRASASAAFTVQ